MALRNFVRRLLLTPVQIAIFLLISFPLALFAAVTTFFSVIFLSSRLLLVYVDLVVAVVFASSPKPTPTTPNTGRGGIKLNTSSPQSRHPYPLMIPRSPPRSPPRSGSGTTGWRSQQQRGGYHQQSFTAPSSPNIGRKRMALSGGFYQQPMQFSQQQHQFGIPSGSSSSGSPPLSMKGGFGKQVGGKTSPGAQFPTPGTMAPPPPPPYSYEGSGTGRGKKGPVVVLEPREEDYFTGRAE